MDNIWFCIGLDVLHIVFSNIERNSIVPRALEKSRALKYCVQKGAQPVKLRDQDFCKGDMFCRVLKQDHFSKTKMNPFDLECSAK
jgi:hypothetical protein